jgi:hypothetical protein
MRMYEKCGIIYDEDDDEDSDDEDSEVFKNRRD